MAENLKVNAKTKSLTWKKKYNELISKIESGEIGGGGVKLYKHTISLGDVYFLRSIIKDTGNTFERTSVTTTLEIISKDSQQYTTLADLLTYESDILAVHVNFGSNQKRLTIDVDIISNVGFHIAYVTASGNGTSVPYTANIYQCELPKTTAITDVVSDF